MGLYQYWLAHPDANMSDLYDKIRDDDKFRLEWAEKCGIGFELPLVVPNVPKIQEIETLLEVA